MCVYYFLFTVAAEKPRNLAPSASTGSLTTSQLPLEEM